MRKQGNEAPVTAKEIGRQLGLSQPTVSRILSGANGHRVSPETRRRVMEAAAQMGYRPNALARSLRQGRTNIVGFYTGYGYLDARNPFQAELLGGLQRAADARRLDILLHGVFRDSATNAATDDIFGELLDGRIDGLFINTRADDPLVEPLRQSSLPVVALADIVPGIPSVAADDPGGIRLLIDYLWEHGHRRIGYIRPNYQFASVEMRFNAFRQALRERGVPDSDVSVYSIEFEFSKQALEAILASPNPPTAVCCWNDMTAFDFLYHCRALGVKVPEDIAVVGFDGLLADRRLAPRDLVTVGASWKDVAERAMDLLMRQIRNRPRGSGYERLGLEGEEAEEDEIPLVTHLPVSLVPGDTA